jgi:hypothetical protein
VRRGWLESWPTRTGTALLVVCLSLSWCQEVRDWCVPFILVGGVSLCLEVIHRIGKVVGVLGLGVVSLLDVSLLVANLVPRGEGLVRTIHPRGRREFVPRGDPPHREGGRRVGFGCGEFAGRSFACGQYEYGANDRSFRSQRSYGPRSPLRGMRSPPRGRVGVPPRRDRMDFANPTFEEMARHWFDSFCTYPSAESFSHSRSRFLFCRWEA